MRFRAAVALWAVLLVLSSCAGDSERPKSVAKAGGGTNAPEPKAPDGMRLVGGGRAVVAVPDSWAFGVGGCGDPGEDIVLVEPPVCPEVGPPRSTLVLRAMRPGLDGLQGAQAVRVDGLNVLRGPLRGCEPNRPCRQTFAVPSEGVSFYLEVLGDDAGRFVTRRISNSLHRLPEGHTTVPLIEYGTSVAKAKVLLAHAGLSGESPDVNFPHYATGTIPGAGSVVAVGDVVELTIGDG